MVKEQDETSIPVIIGFPSPFRLVFRDTDDVWDINLKKVNDCSYDYVKLNRVSAFFDGNIAPYSMVIGFDGSLVLPAFPEFRSRTAALDAFNRVLAECLLGGIYTEAISPADVSTGLLHTSGYIRLWADKPGLACRFHTAIRQQSPNPTEAMSLLHPKTIYASDFIEAVVRGREVLASAPQMSPNIFLTGITYFLRGQWAEALVNLWTCIEQILGKMWDEKVRALVGLEKGDIAGRKNFLDDHRTWPSSVKIEMLYQKGVLDIATYALLDGARKARNNFVHRGTLPTEVVVFQLLEGVLKTLSLCYSNYLSTTELISVLNEIEANVPPELFASKHVPAASEGGYWRKLPSLPGEFGWEGDFEGFDLQLVPVSEIKRKTRGRKK